MEDINLVNSSDNKKDDSIRDYENRIAGIIERMGFFFGGKGLGLSARGQRELANFVVGHQEAKGVSFNEGAEMREKSFSYEEWQNYVTKVVVSWLQYEGINCISVLPGKRDTSFYHPAGKDIIYIDRLEAQKSQGKDNDGEDVYLEAIRLPHILYEDKLLYIEYDWSEAIFIKDENGGIYRAKRKEKDKGGVVLNSNSRDYFVKEGEKLEFIPRQ